MSPATSSRTEEKSLVQSKGGPLDGSTITNPHGYIIAGWSCSRPLKSYEIKYKMPDGKNRRVGASDANYRCRNMNPNGADSCDLCYARFDVGAEALDKDGEVIATIKMITERGDYFWQYSKEYPAYKPSLTWSCHFSDFRHDEAEKKRA